MKGETADLFDQVFPTQAPQHAVVPRREFKPWHKPRKQFIRAHQWNREALKLITRYLDLTIRPAGTEDDPEDFGYASSADRPVEMGIEHPLRCLVLPGEDLLDVRSLWHGIKDLGCWIKYLGFNQGQGSDNLDTRVHIATNEVNALDKIHRQSTVIRDRFQSIASRQSQAYFLMKDAGPFDIVNLDLCDSLFPVRSVGGQAPVGYYNALHQLANYQNAHRTKPWLLFITTQVEPELMDPEGMRKLLQPVGKNCSISRVFAARLAEIVAENAIPSDDGAVDLANLSHEHVFRLFGVGLGKWLLRLVFSGEPKWTVLMLPSYSYGIKENVARMASLAFLFRRKSAPMRDETGLSQLELPVTKPIDEQDCALKLLKAVEGIKDVDGILAGNAGLHREMTEASATLLELAGYDRKAYCEWVKKPETA